MPLHRPNGITPRVRSAGVALTVWASLDSSLVSVHGVVLDAQVTGVMALVPPMVTVP